MRERLPGISAAIEELFLYTVMHSTRQSVVFLWAINLFENCRQRAFALLRIIKSRFSSCSVGHSGGISSDIPKVVYSLCELSTCQLWLLRAQTWSGPGKAREEAFCSLFACLLAKTTKVTAILGSRWKQTVTSCSESSCNSRFSPSTSKKCSTFFSISPLFFCIVSPIQLLYMLLQLDPVHL